MTATGGETILIVDDVDNVRTMLSLALKHHGYAVLEAGSGDAALRIASVHQGRIHLMICDLNLPGMSGPEIAQRLLALRPDVRILFMSGHSSDEAVRKGHIARDQTFLAKPFTLEELASKVRNVLAATLPVDRIAHPRDVAPAPKEEP